MPFLDTRSLPPLERLPGWHGRYFHTPGMTFAHYEFRRGASIHEHFHPEEEVYEVIEGELEITIDGESKIAGPGTVAIVPSNARHVVKALTDGRVIIVDHPARPEFGGPVIAPVQAGRNRGRFQAAALYAALDAQRRARGMTWAQAAAEVGVSASTLTRTKLGGRMEVDGMLAMVRWLGRTVESFTVVESQRRRASSPRTQTSSPPRR